MNNKVKIIHLLCHPPHSTINTIKDPEEYFKGGDYGDFIRINKPPYWVGFFTKDHHVVAAGELKQVSNDFEIECWRPYGNSINEIYTKKIDGITHRVFPSYSKKIYHVGNVSFSPELLEFLLNYIKANNVILNVSAGHAWFHMWLFYKLRKVKKKLPIIAIQLSGGFKDMCFKQLHPVKKIFNWFYLIENKIDLNSLKYVDHYLVGSRVELNYLKNRKRINSALFSLGVDFKSYNKPENKINLRKELGLPVNKKLMIVTGNFKSKDYGYHHLIECYIEIKKKHADIQLIMIGGYKNEDLYEAGLNAGIIMVERIDKDKLLKYYQASDFYGQPSFSWGFIDFGGFGYAMAEALACGLPVISQNIIHFPGSIEERNKIGLGMTTKDDLISNMIFMKDNFQNYTECREISRKYFDIEVTKLELLKYYKNLSLQYFNI